MSLTLCSAVKNSGRVQWALFPFWKCAGGLATLLDVTVASEVQALLSSLVFLLNLSLCSCFSLQLFFPCFWFSRVHSCSAIQLASQTRCWQHCWSIPRVLRWPPRPDFYCHRRSPTPFPKTTASLRASSLGEPQKEPCPPLSFSAIWFSHQNEELLCR